MKEAVENQVKKLVGPTSSVAVCLAVGDGFIEVVHLGQDAICLLQSPKLAKPQQISLFYDTCATKFPLSPCISRFPKFADEGRQLVLALQQEFQVLRHPFFYLSWSLRDRP